MIKRRSNKTLIIIAIVAVGMLAIGLSLFLLINRDQSKLSDDEIKTRFECNRLTLEVRPTDVYCSDPDAFRADVKNNTVIEY